MFFDSAISDWESPALWDDYEPEHLPWKMWKSFYHEARQVPDEEMEAIQQKPLRASRRRRGRRQRAVALVAA